MLVAGALLVMGRGLAYLVDEGLSKQDPELLNRAVIATALIALCLAIGSYLRTTLVNQVGEQVLARIRSALFAHVLGLSPGWFESARTGDILARITTDTAIVQTVMTSTISMAVRNLILLVGGLVMLVLSSPKMSLVVLIVVPLVVAPMIVLGRRLRRASRLAQDRLADVAVQAEESVSAMRTVQAFARQGFVRAKFDGSVDNSLQAALSRVRLRGLMSGIVIFMVFGGISAILWVGGQDLLAGNISAGDLSSFVFYAFLVAASTGFLSDLAGELQRAAGAADRIAAMLQADETLPQPAVPRRIDPACDIACAFEDVDFAYPAAASRPAVSQIRFTVARGERVALVGPSGAGKSTLFHLLLRFYDPDQGRVIVGGQDLRETALDDLRGHIGIVSQDPALFSTTIRENILFGRPDAGETEMVAAAQQAEAHGFITELEGGYDTLVGEKGVRLSGGQRQRLAIARTILRDPGLLLLDEATSALDSRSEAAVQAALDNLSRNRTTLVIAHRLATVVRADRILLIDNGQITATGTHEELIVDSPLYRHLADLQFTTPTGSNTSMSDR
ncbi:MAG: ATP-binding cassette domain-containing protein [Alphaproteobacteria bacterium]|nr:ATP-binding cassette domain-containing protein [Alphaproteobacteria bacterium]MBL6671863.1 ATP-binding cassette domain-containing protein [Alphaproteobacteria bacterium]